MELTPGADGRQRNASHDRSAINALQTVERLAAELGLSDRLHLWLDKSLGTVGVVKRMQRPKEFGKWLNHSWQRISEWPKQS